MTIQERLAPFQADPHLVLGRLGLLGDQPNPALWLKKIVDENDLELLGQMEAELQVWQNEQSGLAESAILSRLRQERGEKLLASDWTQLSDAPLSSEEKTEYRSFRRYLRALPAIWQGGHISEPVCLDFEDWQAAPPVYPDGI